MSDVQFVIGREQLEDIAKAAAAIEACVKAIMAKPDAPVELVAIWTNLAIIQSTVAKLSRTSSQ